MRKSRRLSSHSGALPIVLALMILLATRLRAQQVVRTPDDDVHPSVSASDITIVQHARLILDSPGKWNRADNRICPPNAKTFSIYCALELATTEVTKDFKHRGAAMQEARFVIDDIAPNRNYEHRLMGYNNDPRTTFADVQRVLALLEARITKELAAAPLSKSN